MLGDSSFLTYVTAIIWALITQFPFGSNSPKTYDEIRRNFYY